MTQELNSEVTVFQGQMALKYGFQIDLKDRHTVLSAVAHWKDPTGFNTVHKMRKL